MKWKRRDVLRSGLVGGAALSTSPLALAAAERAAAAGHEPTATAPAPAAPTARVPEVRPAAQLEETTLAELGEAMESGEASAMSLTAGYIERIDGLNETLHAVIEVNPEAMEIAAALDEERRSGRVRGPLHGIPIIVKDNIDTADRMTTTAGSLALEGSVAARDSFVAERLRAAGAVILAKANLSEWANFRSTRSSSGWSGRGGQTRNPYVLDRTPCGSSSGSGNSAAASLCAAAIGTETDGSIVCPSSANSLVGIKPTVGLVSRAGIIPIAHSQDTAGPMARTVADAATVLGALTGADPRDPATASSDGRAESDYTQYLDADGLRGARIGVARNFTGYHERVDALFEDALAAMREAGAEIVDETNLENVSEYGDSELEVLLYEFKADLNAYLEQLGDDAPARSLAELIDFNRANADREMRYFGQEIFEMAQEKGPLTEQAYLDALAKNHRLSREEGIDRRLGEHRLDAIVAPTDGPPWPIDLVTGDHFLGGSSTPAAVSGYASITVPCGYVFGLPVGLSFIGGAYAEPTLVRLAYAYEQATSMRRPPAYLPTFEID